MGLSDWRRQSQLDAKPEFRADAAVDVTLSKYLLYQDPIQSKFLFWTKRMKPDYTEHLLRLAQSFATQTDGDGDINHFYAVYARTLAKKWNLPLRIMEAYQSQDRERIQRLADQDIDEVIELVAELGKCRRKIWKKECKRFGMEVLDHRFGGMINRLQYAKELLTELLEQDTMYSEELEEERLNPTPDLEEREPQATTYYRALRIMSAGKEIWQQAAILKSFTSEIQSSICKQNNRSFICKQNISGGGLHETSDDAGDRRCRRCLASDSL